MTSPKYVFAHFMVGNTYPYTVDDWTADIEEALENHLDGFVLNVGKEDWQRDRVALCFDALSGPRFSSKSFFLFLSFDMSSFPAAEATHVKLLCEYLSVFGDHPRMLKLRDSAGKAKIVVSTFAGESARFGERDLNAGWVFAKAAMESVVGPIHFIPAFFVDPATYSELSCLDGVFNWNGGWPIHLTPSHPRAEIENARLDTDAHHLRNLQKHQTYMAAVSPWFFTHYGVNSWNKNWIYRCDDWLLVRRWEQLLAIRDSIDIVQVISWNDYGESHYICPTIRGAQPNSQKWVDGFSHAAWARLNGYFARAFRDGVFPNIERDEIFWWARPHARDAVAPQDEVPRPRNWELTDDKCWIVILATAPAHVSMAAGDQDVVEADIEAGLTRLSRSLVVGEGIRVTLHRAGKLVVEFRPPDFEFVGTPTVHNFNALSSWVQA
ncbi:hypothetical protein HMN09_01018700 [Mycena chlorophos]|uniref:Glycoside hydrolase family 71 protein n=1 Tax=Mycena chlorophos TaxID=658473 RepID=A0A8H6W1B6_MYCCL|nr:hypothetical protein HMN09_01018700 [Mycena chlorophos]